jgi:hypothetical protein
MKNAKKPKPEENVTAVLLNPRNEPLTPSKYRELSGRNVTDEKATEIIHAIRLLCSILYCFANSENFKYIEDISDSPEMQKDAA